MGLSSDLLSYIDRGVEQTLGSLRGRRLLELGNQRIIDPEIRERTGKEYYERRGVQHTSFDLNGRDGAIRVDLSRRSTNPRWHHGFDVVTNPGTTEHVEPYEAQYECFWNIHDWLEPGGICIHIVPDVHQLDAHGAWAGHCGNYYSREFFEMLAESNGYALANPQIIRGMICVCLRKERDVPFMDDRHKLLSQIARRGGGKVYKGINDGARLLRPLRRAVRRAVRAVGSLGRPT